jgi:membrane protein DedA with SNARE-associated domain
VDLWVSFWSALTGFIPDNGLLTVAAIVLLRSAGVPIPVPADLLVVMVGVEAREQHLSLWPAWLVLSGATTCGALLLYLFARWIGGRGDLGRYGRYVGLNAARLRVAEQRLDARGTRAVFVARIVPGLRLAIVAVCGMLRFEWWKFVPAVILGALIYVGLCLTLGYVFGAQIVETIGQLVFPLGLLEPLIGLTILLVWLVRARGVTTRQETRVPLRRSRRVRAGALAGALAILGATMFINVCIYLGGPLAAAVLAGMRNVESAVMFSGGLAGFIQALLGCIVVGILWGVLYALADLRWAAEWHDWLRGLSFAALPLAIVLGAQWLAAVQRGQPLSAWLVVAVGEAIRWGVYGALLGLVYPVLRARRVRSSARRQATEPTMIMVEAPLE